MFFIHTSSNTTDRNTDLEITPIGVTLHTVLPKLYDLASDCIMVKKKLGVLPHRFTFSQ